MLDDFLCELFSAERRKGGGAHERALEATHVRANAVGDKLENLILQFDLQRTRFFAQDRHARLDVRRLKLCGKPPFEAGNQPVLQVRDLRSGPVAGEHDLFMSVEKRVERVKKFFLGTLLASQKLDIVNQKKIGLAITLPEFDQIAVLDRIDELVDEKFTRDVYHLHIFLLRPDVLTNRLHQMGLAETDPAVNEQRVIRARG